ncbi:uncharacterized protein LOC117320913 [Pecten maximus]|uniref:uncharacterized protein LOC117320913 n=1 Tax=Pecten maximus TaxID=6579 RepID=UPI0014581653|nr:uncharacterized protein LOC117320913 [Pecten maximus]
MICMGMTSIVIYRNIQRVCVGDFICLSRTVIPEDSGGDSIRLSRTVVLDNGGGDSIRLSVVMMEAAAVVATTALATAMGTAMGTAVLFNLSEMTCDSGKRQI